jgi:hypothetical protein
MSRIHHLSTYVAELHKPEYADLLIWLDGVFERAAAAGSRTARQNVLKDLNALRWKANNAVRAAAPLKERHRSDNQNHDDLYDLHAAMGWDFIDPAEHGFDALSQLNSRAALLKLYISNRSPEHETKRKAGQWVPKVLVFIAPVWIRPIAQHRPDLLREALRAGAEKRKAILFQATHANTTAKTRDN